VVEELTGNIVSEKRPAEEFCALQSSNATPAVKDSSRTLFLNAQIALLTLV